MKKILKITAGLLAAVILIFGCIKLFVPGSGADYMRADKVVMRVEGGNITWSEFYGWLCYSKVQVETVLGRTIADWNDDVTTEQTIAEYVKEYALYLIKTYKAVESNAAVIGITLTDEEKQNIANEFAGMSESEKQTVFAMYGGEEFYMYLTELGALHTKCHDFQYGENGKNTDDEYVSQYISDNGVMMFKGFLVPEDEDYEAILEELNKAEDKAAVITSLRTQYMVDDGYDNGYLFASGNFEEDAEEELGKVEIGECTYADTDDGTWIMLRCEADADSVVYDTENTLREQVSWYIFGSVVDGWSENLKVMTGDLYDSIDVAKVFG